MYLTRDDGVILEALTGGGQSLPDLAPVFTLHHQLRTAQVRVKNDLRRESHSHHSSPLRFTDLDIEPAKLTRAAEAIIAVLRQHLPGLEGEQLSLSPQEWIDHSQRWFASGRAPGDTEGDVILLAAALATVPWLEIVADKNQAGELPAPSCPTCAGSPDLGLLTAEGRILVCARCTSEWSYPRLGCPFCGSPDWRYFPGFLPGDRLYVCQRCRGYLKTVDMRERSGTLIAQYERIRLVPLDFAAESRDYHLGYVSSVGVL